MHWQRPATILISLEHLSDRVRLRCRIEGVLPEPIAPASLWSHPIEGASMYDLHRVAGRSESTTTFETFRIEKRPPPLVGTTLYLQSHWLPEAMEAATDRKATWEHRVHPDDGDHHHCLFTWEAISSYGSTKDGYWSDQYGWITTQAYLDFILNDVYQLRDA